jgi:ABC-type transport system involved in multi-copper enzyme maturation permease subunit
MSIATIMRLTIREAMRRKVLWGLLILSAIFLLLYTLGMSFIHQQINRYGTSNELSPTLIRSGYSFLLIAGLYAANFLIVMLSVLLPIDTLAGEISTGTIQSLAVKPLPRRNLLLGKWLGFVIMLGSCALLLGGGVMLITFLVAGYSAANWPTGLIVMFLETLIFLSVSLLGGTRLSTLANGVLGFGLFGVAFIGGFIEYIGNFFFNSDTVTNVGRLTTYIMPSDALWRLAVSDVAEGQNPFKLAFGGLSQPDTGIVTYAIVFAAVVLLVALWSFQRRDL